MFAYRLTPHELLPRTTKPPLALTSAGRVPNVAVAMSTPITGTAQPPWRRRGSREREPGAQAPGSVLRYPGGRGQLLVTVRLMA